MTSKTLFLKQKELRDYLNAVVKSDHFKQCLIYVRGELMETSNLTPHGIDGAKAFEQILLGFTDEEPDLDQFPAPQLYHDLDPKRKTSDKSK